MELIAHRLVSEGFGSWLEVMETPVEAVMDAFHYAIFQAEYQETITELNRDQ